MGTTNNGLHYPEAGDLVRNFPAVQRASQEAIDARISELDEGLQPVRAATDAREGGTLVKRRRDGGSNHQSLWVAEVPKNTGSVTHKGYVDDADAATLAAAKDHANDLPAAALPNLPASKITSGTFASARLPGGTAALLNTGTSSTNYGWSPRVLRDYVTNAVSGIEALPRIDTSVGTRVMVGGVMVHGDTGWRNVIDNATGRLASGGIRVRRVNDRVRVAVRSLDASDTGFWIVLNHGAGWRPTTSGMVVVSPSGTADMSTLNWILYLSSIQCRPEGAVSGSAWVQFDYETSDSWPTSLPGTPA